MKNIMIIALAFASTACTVSDGGDDNIAPADAGAPVDQTGCSGDNDCDAGNVCEANECVAGCHEDRDCSRSEVCAIERGESVGACEENRSCRMNSECDTHIGEVCSNRTCQVITEVTCRSDDDCAFGDRESDDSAISGVCESGTCRIGNYNACSGDEFCSSSSSCVDNGQGSSSCMGDCTVPSDCDTFETCIMGAGNVGMCYYNICGEEAELDAQWAQASCGSGECNGSLGGLCNGHSDMDGFCLTQPASQTTVLGICIAGEGGQVCDIVGENTCNDGEACVMKGINDATSTCAPTGGRAAGAQCNAEAEVSECGHGLLCVQGSCLQFCQPPEVTACPDGTQCTALGQLQADLALSPLGLCVPPR